MIKKNKNYWKKTVIKKNNNLGHVIKNLNDSGLKISLIVDTNKKLIGTITDGDVRRGLLNGLNLKDKINSIINYKPVFLTNQSDRETALKLMKDNFIENIPVINSQKKICGLFYVNELISFKQKKINNTKIVIMAGGLGKRLMPLTKNKPKPLLEIQGKPMLEHLVLNMKKFGFYTLISFAMPFCSNLVMLKLK